MAAQTTNLSVLFSTLLGGLIVALIYMTLQRLYLSPLSKFPGPKLAALSKAWQFYFDVIKTGKLPWELVRLHEVYGPIVRIGPNEVHISDPEFYDVLYTGGRDRRDKDIFAIDSFGLAKSVIATVNHHHHRLRRSALNPFFSTQAVAKLEPTVKAKVDAVCQHFKRARETGTAINIEVVFAALTTDIISEYAFARDTGYLDNMDKATEWTEVLRDSAHSSNLFRYCPLLIRLLQDAPPWLVRMMDPKLLQLVSLKTECAKQVQEVMDAQDSGKTPERKTIFHELLANENLPPNEKTLPRLTEEAQIIIAAGASTTTHYLKSTVYFILADPAILRRLQAELEEAMPDPGKLPPQHLLERLTYLNAVYKEGCRINDGASSRLARIAPDQDLRYKHYVIPRGTSVSMSTYIQHRDTTLFPDPEKFDPERWLQQPDDSSSNRLERYLVNFCKGGRNCLGMSLARAEIFLTLAALFRRFDMELVDTIRERDVDMMHDFFVPHASLESKGIKVMVKGIRN